MISSVFRTNACVIGMSYIRLALVAIKGFMEFKIKIKKKMLVH
jgi:hypothetical protein